MHFKRKTALAKTKTIDRTKFDNSWYKPGPFWKRTLWYYTNSIFFESPWFPFYKLKVVLLRLFGASVGQSVLIKPQVNIKYPWFLEIGDYVSIGEGVWIDNLGKVVVQDYVTISQGALLLSGNHDYKSEGFDLIVTEIILEEGAWIGAKSTVGPGVRVGRNTVLGIAAIAVKNLEPDCIYFGNPATKVRDRIIT